MYWNPKPFLSKYRLMYQMKSVYHLLYTYQTCWKSCNKIFARLESLVTYYNCNLRRIGQIHFRRIQILWDNFVYVSRHSLLLVLFVLIDNNWQLQALQLEQCRIENSALC